MKYHNRKITFDGEVFDSKKEFIRYQELKLLEKAGDIKDLKRQVPYVLIPTQRSSDGRVIERECKYIADFVYFDCGASTFVCEDTKGFRTKDYIIKRKLMLWLNGIRIKEI